VQAADCWNGCRDSSWNLINAAACTKSSSPASLSPFRAANKVRRRARLALSGLPDSRKRTVDLAVINFLHRLEAESCITNSGFLCGGKKAAREAENSTRLQIWRRRRQTCCGNCPTYSDYVLDACESCKADLKLWPV
jgi:hypothetical protein